MAKFSKYIFGGILGAGLAMLFTPKKGSEVRQMLMSGRRPAELPSAPQPAASAPPVTAPAPERVAPPVAEPAAAPIDLEARIAETRRQVETELETPVLEAAPVEPSVEPPAASHEEAVDQVAVEAAAMDEPVPPETTEPAAVVETASEAAVEPQIDEPAVEPPQTDEPAPAAPVDAHDFLDEQEESVAAAPVDQAPAEAKIEPPAAPEEPEEEPQAPSEPEDLSWQDDAWIIREEQVEPDIATPEAESEPKASEIEAATEAAAEAPIEAPAPRNDLEVEEREEAGAEASGDFELEESDNLSYLSTPAAGEPELEGETLGDTEPELVAPAAEPEAPAEPEAGAEAAEPDKPAFDREEMRRRIEETRARLKAKAFDAMVSGESFISTEHEEDSEGSTVDLDREAQSAIEQTLREDD